MKRLLKDLILFVVFGAIYFVLQSLWESSTTHWTIFLLGGFISIVISDINGKIHWKTPILQQVTIGMGVAIFCDAAIGIVINVLLRMEMWHYTRMAFLWDQCSLPFCVIWLILATACIFLDDFLRWKMLGEEKPHYTLR